MFGFDITKRKEYEEADLLHIHWLSEGFIRLKSLSKVDKPIIWTMRDEWAYTGGAHYKSDFEKYVCGHYFVGKDSSGKHGIFPIGIVHKNFIDTGVLK